MNAKDKRFIDVIHNHLTELSQQERMELLIMTDKEIKEKEKQLKKQKLMDTLVEFNLMLKSMLKSMRADYLIKDLDKRNNEAKQQDA